MGDETHPERRMSVLTDFIVNWQDEVVGAFCHIQDLDYLYRVFEAIQLILSQWADTDSVIQNALHAAQRLGHKWGRLYTVSADDPSMFVSLDCFGIDGELAAEFKAHRITLKRRSEPGHEAWGCVDHVQPLVFGCFPDRANGERFDTAHGLEVTNVQQSQCPPGLEKRSGDFWIDFPLIAGKTALGKITLACHAEYLPENFVFLEKLCLLTTKLLEASIRSEERMDWIHEASERAIADTSHHIVSSLAALPILLSRYRRLEEDDPNLVALNEDFKHLWEQVGTRIRHTKDRLSPIAVQRARHDILANLNESLRAALPDDMWDIAGPVGGPLEADFDARLLDGVVLELVQNSRQCSLAPANLKVTATVQTQRRGEEEWLVIRYRDNGPGVPAELKEKIFENFYSRRPGRETGTGLGMGYISRVIEAHGGHIRETGQPREGICFVIHIPRFASDQPKDEAEVNYEIAVG
jgi:hypothetical protein